MHKPGDEYRKALQFARLARSRLGTRLRKALKALGDPYLIRARVVSSRIKALSSLKWKAKTHGWWSMGTALKEATDLVGFRVVCNNAQDASRAADLLQQQLEAQGIEVKREDHTEKSVKGGYRAIHLVIRLPVEIGDEKMIVGCEVQIRTLLQDAWGHLSHDDVYKAGGNVPKSLGKQMENLSKLLAAADAIADDIRAEISQARSGKKPKKGATLNRPTIAFLYRRAFEADAPAYLVEQTMRGVEGKQVRAEVLESVLNDKQLRDRLTAPYRNRFGLEPDPASIFRWTVRAAVSGPEAGLRLAKREVKAQWREIERTWRHEVLSGLPETWQEYVDDLGRTEDGEPGRDLSSEADALGALGDCAMCGVSLVQPDALAEALVEYYELEGEEADEAREQIEQAVIDSGVEIADILNPGLCTYHARGLEKALERGRLTSDPRAA